MAVEKEGYSDGKGPEMCGWDEMDTAGRRPGAGALFGG